MQNIINNIACSELQIKTEQYSKNLTRFLFKNVQGRGAKTYKIYLLSSIPKFKCTNLYVVWFGYLFKTFIKKYRILKVSQGNSENCTRVQYYMYSMYNKTLIFNCQRYRSVMYSYSSTFFFLKQEFNEIVLSSSHKPFLRYTLHKNMFSFRLTIQIAIVMC